MSQLAKERAKGLLAWLVIWSVVLIGSAIEHGVPAQ